MSLQIGQVLSLKIRFNNNGQIAQIKHPCLIVDINNDDNYVEIAHIDSLKGKPYKAMFRGNKAIFNNNPVETVIDEDSFVQLDNTIRIEMCAELENNYLRQPDTLSATKLNDVLTAYKNYHNNNIIDANKNVFMDRNEILLLNQHHPCQQNFQVC